MKKLFLLYILFGFTKGLPNTASINNTIKNKVKPEEQPFCSNCGKFGNNLNDMISLKLKEAQFEKINKCKIKFSTHNVEKHELNFLFLLTFV